MDEQSLLKRRLLEAHTSIVIWGGGYVGLSTAMYYAAKGVKSTIVDTDPERVRAINSGRSCLPLFEEWVGFPLHPLVADGVIRATARVSEVPPRAGPHFVAVPTERAGMPWDDALDDVFSIVATMSPEICIVESTMSPGKARGLVSRYGNLPLCVAPRRDWFLGAGRDLASLPRVYGARTTALAELAEAVLSIVCRELVLASDCDSAELSKCIENSLHHVGAMYATELARAFPHLAVNEAFELAATHWRIGTVYFASAGTGGYCLPVSTQHLRRAAGDTGALSIAAAASTFDSEHRQYVAQVLAARTNGPIGILGITYRGDVPSTTLSPFVDIARLLRERGVEVHVHDPCYSFAQISKLVDCRALTFPEGLSECSTVLLGPAHRLYRSLSADALLEHLLRGQVLVDNEGAWGHMEEAFGEAGVRYCRIGNPAWTVLCSEVR